MLSKQDRLAVWVLITLVVALVALPIHTTISAVAAFLGIAICYGAMEWIYFRTFFKGGDARSDRAKIYLALAIVPALLFAAACAFALLAAKSSESGARFKLIVAASVIALLAALARMFLLRRWRTR